MAATVAPDRILHEMTDLWVSLGKQGEGEAGVLRACSMTLVVAAEESDDPQAIGETLAALMPEHPSRAIVVRFRGGDERAMTARVFAQCWMPFGQRRQICCEQIEILTADAGVPDLVSVLLPLLVPDLPVVLWCRSPRLFHLPAFPQLAAIGHKVVVDSAAFGEPGAILTEMTQGVASGRLLADFSWTRLTRLRELISQIFENKAQLAQLSRVMEVHVSYCGPRTPASAFYMGAWLIDGLRAFGGRPGIRFGGGSVEASPEVNRVELRTGDGAEALATIALVEGHAAEVQVGGLGHRAVLPRPNDYTLMREELSIPGRDPVFERTLAAAARLALS